MEGVGLADWMKIAAKSTEADVCRLLLWKGASPNVRTRSG